MCIPLHHNIQNSDYLATNTPSYTNISRDMFALKNRKKLLRSLKQPSASSQDHSNRNHLFSSQKPGFSSKAPDSQSEEDNNSVISVNTLIENKDSGSIDQNKKAKKERPRKSQMQIRGIGQKNLFLKKKTSASILRSRKGKFQPSGLVEYYSRSSFQKA